MPDRMRKCRDVLKQERGQDEYDRSVEGEAVGHTDTQRNAVQAWGFLAKPTLWQQTTTRLFVLCLLCQPRVILALSSVKRV